jgi:hypothetical protein
VKKKIVVQRDMVHMLQYNTKQKTDIVVRNKQGYSETLIMFNAYCFSTVTMVYTNVFLQ